MLLKRLPQLHMENAIWGQWERGAEGKLVVFVYT